jgi:geranylgeranyl diphosphate synthase type I
MDVRKELSEFKKRIDKELEIFLEKEIKKVQKSDPFLADGLVSVKKILLSGGKRLRGALMYFGYLLAGGKNTKEALKASMSFELVHMYLLIHDDVMDRDDVRHGEVTLHKRYAEQAKKAGRKDADHFGNAIATSLGDMVSALGSQCLFFAQFPPERIIRALQKLQEVIYSTVIGQVKDIRMSYLLEEPSLEEVFSMYEMKTARYTFEGPLTLGIILAGGSDSLLNSVREYALPLGVAYQIQDDILGVYGNEEKTGKRVGSDIEEGKGTLLVAYTFLYGTQEHKKILKQCLGKSISKEMLGRIRQIFRESGALSYAQDMSKQYIQKGVYAGESIEAENEYAKDFLVACGHYLDKREV